MRNLRKGFTLLELIVVIVVLGILAAIAIPTFAGVISRANKSSALTSAQAFQSEVKTLYAQDNAGSSAVIGTTDLTTQETAAAVDIAAAAVAVGPKTGYDFSVSGQTVNVSSTGVIS